MSKSPWGNIGAWAAEAEREEAEEKEAAAKSAASQPPPSLKEAVSTTKQKKKTKMTLQEFTMQHSTHSGSAPSRGLTPEEMFRLPTGPKDRSPDEMQYGGRLGGGFSDYGSRGGSMGPNQGRSQENEGRRSYAFDDNNRRGGPPHARVSELDQPSRADEVDSWASMKRQTPQTLPDNSFGQARTGSRYGSLGGGGGPGVASRADEVDNWASVKKPISQPLQQPRSSSFGSGFSRPDSDRWTRNEPQRLVLDPPKSEAEVVVKVNKPNLFGAARPREDVLAEKGLDWKKLDLDVEAKEQSVSGASRPTSSQSSRPESAHSIRSEIAVEAVEKQRPKVNPFGDARPREVLLEEKGLDWKKIDSKLENRRVDRPETEEEKNLKEEIENLKKELPQKLGDEQIGVQEFIHKMEQELELMTRELDDKVRYNQKVYERPGSGSGRPPSRPGSYEESRVDFHDRPPSRPGSYEGYPQRPPSRTGAYEDPRPNYHDRPRSRPGVYEDQRGGFPHRSSFMSGGYQDPSAVDYNEMAPSRGTGNSWTRDDRRGGIQGGGGRGYFGSREVNSSGSRW